MGQDVVRIPSDFQVSDREIVRTMFIDDVYDYPGHMLNLPEVHKYYTGEGIHMCVLDTGLYRRHPDLDDDIFKKSFTDDKYDIEDRHGHSTHVRGIINMQRNGKGYVGIAPGAKVHIGKVMKAGAGSPDWLAAGIDWCVEMKFDIIVGSLGTSRNLKVIREAVERAARAGILMFFASGNEGASRVLFPAGLPDGIAIGAVDAAKLLANFSNTGTALDLVAPGVGIKSSWIDGNYKESSGTSMATPIAAGVAALYLQAARQRDTGIPPFKIRDKLYQSSEDLGDRGLDIKYGYGLVSTHSVMSGKVVLVDDDKLKDHFGEDYLAPARGCLLALLVSAALWAGIYYSLSSIL